MGSVLALLSSGLWGTADFIAGDLSRRRAPMAIAGAVQVVGLVVMIAIMFATGAHVAGVAVGDYLPYAMAASVFDLVGLVALYTALAIAPMGMVSPIAALGVVVPVGWGLLQGEQPGPWQVIGIMVGIIGVVLASGPEVSGGVGLRPVILALVSALGLGLFQIVIAEGAEASPVMTMTAQRTTSVVLVLIVFLFARSLGGLTGSDAPRLVAVGVFDLMANLLFAIATTVGLLSLVAVLGSLYPVFTVLLAWTILREKLLPAQYSGVALAFAGVVMITAG